MSVLNHELCLDALGDWMYSYLLRIAEVVWCEHSQGILTEFAHDLGTPKPRQIDFNSLASIPFAFVLCVSLIFVIHAFLNMFLIPRLELFHAISIGSMFGMSCAILCVETAPCCSSSEVGRSSTKSGEHQTMQHDRDLTNLANVLSENHNF